MEIKVNKCYNHAKKEGCSTRQFPKLLHPSFKDMLIYCLYVGIGRLLA